MNLNTHKKPIIYCQKVSYKSSWTDKDSVIRGDSD